MSSKGFYKEQGVIEFMGEFLSIDPGQIADKQFRMDRISRSKFEKEIRGKREL